jgi:hypothetical protein
MASSQENDDQLPLDSIEDQESLSGSDGGDSPMEEDQERILFVERFLNASVKLLLESDSDDDQRWKLDDNVLKK